MDTLPDELLFEIINQLYLEDVEAVWNISIANRQLHRIANELLCRCYSLNDISPGLFIRKLASSPNLERCVQHVNWVSTNDAFKFPEALTTAEFRQISERVGLNKEGRKITTTRREIQNLNAWLAGRGQEEYFNTFMLFTPKVKTILIAKPQTWSRKVTWFKPALHSRIFTNLKEATINGGMRIGNVLPLFLLPSMRTLTLSHLSIDRNQDGVGPPYEWEANTAVWKRLEREGSNIEHLHLPRVGTDTLDLVRVLGPLRNLKKFEFVFRGHGIGQHDVDLETLLHAITRHHTSLTSLAFQDHRLDHERSLLRELSFLEHLDCLELESLVFYEEYPISTPESLAQSLPRDFWNLPRHLKHLRLSAMEDYFDLTEPLLDVLLEMAPTIDTILPNLESMTFCDWHPQLGTFPCQTRIAALQSALAKAGVEFFSAHHHNTSESWYDEWGVGMSTNIEEGWMWVQILMDDVHGNSDCPWFREFGSYMKGNELVDGMESMGDHASMDDDASMDDY